MKLKINKAELEAFTNLANTFSKWYCKNSTNKCSYYNIINMFLFFTFEKYSLFF